MDKDKVKRPSADKIYETLRNWIENIKIFEDSEKIKIESLTMRQA
ncbi:12991_t:CDS:1, partial [Dentiscutata heterogama]